MFLCVLCFFFQFSVCLFFPSSPGLAQPSTRLILALCHAQMSIQPAQTGAAMQGAPSQWQVVGSNDVNCDDDSNWTVLCEDLSDRKWRSTYEVRYCRMPQNKQEFRCVGIRVLNNFRSDGWTSLRNIRLWEQA